MLGTWLTGKDVTLGFKNPEAEAQKFVDWFTDPEVTQYVSTDFSGHDFRKQMEFFQRAEHRTDAMYWMIFENAGGGVIGSTSFNEIDWDKGRVDWGIVIADKSRWGLGYGKEALQLLMHHAFCDLSMDLFHISVFEANLRGLKCYTACGFTERSRELKTLASGAPATLIHLEMTEAEYHLLSSHN